MQKRRHVHKIKWRKLYLLSNQERPLIPVW